MALGDLTLSNQNLSIEVRSGVVTYGDLVTLYNQPNIPENTYTVEGIEQIRNRSAAGGKEVLVSLSRGRKLHCTALVKV